MYKSNLYFLRVFCFNALCGKSHYNDKIPIYTELDWEKNSLIFFRLSILLHLLPGCFLSFEQGIWSYSKINQPFKQGGAFKVIITSYLNVLLLCVWFFKTQPQPLHSVIMSQYWKKGNIFGQFGWQVSGQPIIFHFVQY